VLTDNCGCKHEDRGTLGLQPALVVRFSSRTPSREPTLLSNDVQLWSPYEASPNGIPCARRTVEAQICA
jgi:hypothetical protein